MILRICIVVPTYNNPESIASVIQDLAQNTPYRVLVVDDGSVTPVETKLREAGVESLLTSNRVRILRFEENRGKGVAIAAAIADCVEHGFTHILSIDGDGQHLTSEIQKVVEVAAENPWSLVIGRRKFESATVPGASKFGRAFSNFWVNYQTGVKVSDSQSGFRIYPLFHVQNMNFVTKRYDFEIEILIRLLWKNIVVHEVEIEVFYPEPHLRVSHFNKFHDNVRISILNTVLVVVSLLKSQSSSVRTSLSLGVGIFTGCLPFYGFHTLLVGLFAFLFRLNAAVMFLGSQVSIPPLAPFLILGSVYVGRLVLGTTGMADVSVASLRQMSFEQLIVLGRTEFTAWAVGGVIIGTILGVAGGLSLYLGTSASSAATKKASGWNGRMRGGAFGNSFLKLVLQSMGLRAGYFCLCFVVPYFYVFAPKARRASNEYWRIRGPKGSWMSRQFKVIAHQFRYGQVLMDQVIQKHRPTTLFTAKAEGIENIVKAVIVKRGLLLLSAHVGSWGLASAILRQRHPGNHMKIVQYRADGFTFSDVNESDPRSGDAEQSVFAIRDLLRGGTPLGVMADRPLESRYELIRFMGKLAPFDSTPFKLSAAMGVPMVHAFGFKGEGLTYEFFSTVARVYKYAPGEDRELACIRWMEEFAAELSSKLERFPDQWFNFFPFWSTEPQAPDLPKMPSESRQIKSKLAKSKIKTIHDEI